jgi:hypothetical protein
MPNVPSTVNRTTSFETAIERYLVRRAWPIAASTLFIASALLYFFRWSPTVRHVRSLWVVPTDIWATYGASSALAHGHLGSIYGSGFLAFPGFLVVLAPLGALSGRFNTILVQVTSHGHAVAGGNIYTSPGTQLVQSNGVTNGGDLYAVHQGVFALLALYILLIACTSLFAFDAMAEELGVERWRRGVLAGVEAVLLWSVVVAGGHPEDALAVALVTWALLWAFQGRWTGAGWLFGAAVAVQPLVIVVFPLLLVLGGRGRALGLFVRGAVPAVAVAIGPLVADVHRTARALVDQPTFPNLRLNFKTPWIAFAPNLGGSGQLKTVGGGPVRLLALVLAAGLGWWSLRWRQRHEMIVWAAALALALRVYTESVMTPYYSWPALAFGVLIATRATNRRFTLATLAALATLVVGQWHIDSYVWWALQVAGVTGVLVAAASPAPPEPAVPATRAKGPAAGRRSRAA